MMETSSRKRGHGSDDWDGIIWGVLGFIIFVSMIVAYIYVIVVQQHFTIPAQERAYERIADAHQAHDYAAVVDIYHSRPDIRFWFDREVSTMWHNFMYIRTEPAEVNVRVGDAYAHLGDEAAAARHYLKAVGWSEAQYDGWCKLAGDCPPLSQMAKRSLTDAFPTQE